MKSIVERKLKSKSTTSEADAHNANVLHADSDDEEDIFGLMTHITNKSKP